MQEYFRVLPDLRFDVDLVVASGDQVFTRWLLTGTYSGVSMSHAPSDRRFEEYGCTLSKLGQMGIVHVWHYWETDHMLPRRAGQ